LADRLNDHGKLWLRTVKAGTRPLRTAEPAAERQGHAGGFTTQPQGPTNRYATLATAQILFSDADGGHKFSRIGCSI
jgi:hypothetical protein